jgi:hypothetical protein
MSFLKKSLEKRIRELRHSIEAQTTELAAYEQVLALESGKPMILGPAPAAIAEAVKSRSSGLPGDVEFNGRRSDFVASVLKQRGTEGASPAEISAAFSTRKIAVSKNLVYNVLSAMFKQKKVRRSGGKYYLMAGKSAAQKKQHISEEGMSRIIATTKKRWPLAHAGKSNAR